MEATHRQAARLISQGRLQDAAKALEAARPYEQAAEPEIYAQLAFLSSLRGADEAVRKALQEGLKHHPDSPILLCGWGTFQWEAGDRREAVSAWERAFQKLPEWSRIDYLVTSATLGEALASPPRKVESAVYRITPLYLPDTQAEWHQGQLDQRGEDWVLALDGDQDGADRLLPGVRVLAVASDENGLYSRRARIARVLPGAQKALALEFLEPIHRVQRRRHVRILAHNIASGSFTGPDRRSVPVTVTSLSASGIAFTTPLCLTVGARIRLALVVDPTGAHSPGVVASKKSPDLHSLGLEAEVKRCKPQGEKQFACSAHFVISTRDQDTLARLIHLVQLNLRRLEHDSR